jgi:hypothetical protein
MKYVNATSVRWRVTKVPALGNRNLEIRVFEDEDEDEDE